MIPRFRYTTFRWIFSVGNAVVWSFILYNLGGLVHDCFAEADGLSREGALYLFTLAPLVSTVLASQGAIVALRDQFLIGRFSVPATSPAAPPEPSNVWLVSFRSALPFAITAAPLTLLALGLLLPPTATNTTTARLMGGIGGALAFLIAFVIADREFHRYQFHLGRVRPRMGLTRYLWGNLAAPWGTINATLNAVFAWMLYHQGPGHSGALVGIEELRLDFATTTFMVCVFTALPVIAEAGTDFAAGITPPVVDLPAMPRLWLRFAIAGGLAAAVWLTVTVWARASGSEGVTLETTMAIKAAGGGGLAALVAVLCGRWTLARCHAVAALAEPRRAAVA